MPPIPFANVLQPLIDVFERIIIFFHDEIGLGWGWSIVVLTAAVRLVLLPLMVRQFKSMQTLARLGPEIKALQAKYKGDKQRQQQEMMRFYQEHKVNPFASCLPLVLQLPVFLGLYYMLRKDLKTNICPGITEFAAQHHQSVSNIACHQVPTSHGAEQFLFIPDLTTKATGGVLVALIVLYVGTQLASSLLSPTTDRNQRMIMVALPIVFVMFIIRFPTGLIVYWITTNAWTAVQQLIIRRSVGPVTPATAGAPAGAAAAVGGSGGGGLLESLGLGRHKPDDAARATTKPRKERAPATEAGESKSAPASKASKASKAKPAARSRPGAAPPPPPRKKKKRSGRRR